MGDTTDQCTAQALPSHPPPSPSRHPPPLPITHSSILCDVKFVPALPLVSPLRFDAQMQAQLIASLLSTRLTVDGRPLCVTSDFNEDMPTTVRCTGGSPSADSERVVFSFEFTKVGGAERGSSKSRA